MSGPDNQFEALARDAAGRIAASRDLAEQLTLLPDEAAPVQGGEAGRPKRGQGKALNQMRDWLAARGYRMPEDVLAEMAGLASREDAILTAMVQAERILAWSGEGAANRVFKVGIGHVELEGPWKPSPDQKLATFMQIYATMLRAADALMPYGTPKASPDVTNNVQVNQIVVAGAAPVAADRPVQARDVTPQARRIAPPPLPGEIVGNQGLAPMRVAPSDGQDRTE